MIPIVSSLLGLITGHLAARSYLRYHPRPHWPSLLIMLVVLAVAAFFGSLIIVWFLHKMMIG